MCSKYTVDSPSHINDAEWLREKYIEEEKSIEKIADIVGYSVSTVRSRLNEYNIPIRKQGKASHETKKYWDDEWLEEKYWEDGLSCSQIADQCDASTESVRQMMVRKNIPRREPKFDWYDAVPLKLDYTGHPNWRHVFDQETYVVAVHSLLKIADGADPHEVFDDETVVHHKNHIPFDNRAENLTLMDKDDHLRHHSRNHHKNNL